MHFFGKCKKKHQFYLECGGHPVLEKDLKKLNRRQLLDFLLKQTERTELLEQQLQEADGKLTVLTEQNGLLKQQLQEADEKLMVLTKQNGLLEQQIREAKEKIAVLSVPQKTKKKFFKTPYESDTRMEGVLEAALIQYLKNLEELNRKKPQKKQDNIKHAEK